MTGSNAVYVCWPLSKAVTYLPPVSSHAHLMHISFTFTNSSELDEFHIRNYEPTRINSKATKYRHRKSRVHTRDTGKHSSRDSHSDDDDNDADAVDGDINVTSARREEGLRRVRFDKNVDSRGISDESLGEKNSARSIHIDFGSLALGPDDSNEESEDDSLNYRSVRTKAVNASSKQSFKGTIKPKTASESQKVNEQFLTPRETESHADIYGLCSTASSKSKEVDRHDNSSPDDSPHALDWNSSSDRFQQLSAYGSNPPSVNSSPSKQLVPMLDLSRVSTPVKSPRPTTFEEPSQDNFDNIQHNPIHHYNANALAYPSSRIYIESNPFIEAESFTLLWDTLDACDSFRARIIPEISLRDVKVIQLIEHLQNECFFIVAAGNVDNVISIYAFSVGYVQLEERGLTTTVSFLVELKLFMSDSNEYGNQNDMWLLNCLYKCTDVANTSQFLKNMKLADVLQLAQ